jgi:hypothetical protein
MATLPFPEFTQLAERWDYKGIPVNSGRLANLLKWILLTFHLSTI